MLLNDRILRVALKTRVDALCNLGVSFECLGDSHGICHSRSNTHFKSLAGAHGQPGVEGVKSSTHGLQDKVQLVVEFLVIEADAATDQIRVSSNVLGYGVSDDIGAEEKWVLVDWGHEGVVNDTENTLLLADLRDSLYIEDLKGWVGRGLDPDNFGIWSDEFSES